MSAIHCSSNTFSSYVSQGHILQSPSANVLPTLPFHVLRSLFSSTPLTTDDGLLLRRMALEIGAIHLILACLSALSHHAPRVPSGSANSSEVREHKYHSCTLCLWIFGKFKAMTLDFCHS